VVGSVRVVLCAPALDHQLIGAAAAERAGPRLAHIFYGVAVHVGEVVGIERAHGVPRGFAGVARGQDELTRGPGAPHLLAVTVRQAASAACG